MNLNMKVIHLVCDGPEVKNFTGHDGKILLRENFPCENESVYYLDDGWMLVVDAKGYYTDLVFPESKNYDVLCFINQTIPYKILMDLRNFLIRHRIHKADSAINKNMYYVDELTALFKLQNDNHSFDKDNFNKIYESINRFIEVIEEEVVKAFIVENLD